VQYSILLLKYSYASPTLTVFAHDGCAHCRRSLRHMLGGGMVILYNALACPGALASLHEAHERSMTSEPLGLMIQRQASFFQTGNAHQLWVVHASTPPDMRSSAFHPISASLALGCFRAAEFRPRHPQNQYLPESLWRGRRRNDRTTWCDKPVAPFPEP